ncbi:MAG: transcription termination/antitermination NusG family protein [Pseudolabrys sp.]
MLAKTPGNLSAVWDAISGPAERAIKERVERQNPVDAEISEGPAQWFLIRTFPGDDARALRWLARRRFGAFRPMQQRRDKLTGKSVQGWEAAFPGWIFVLCWDVNKMHARIMSTPGVMGLLCDPATNKPVPIDDEFIDRVRTLSWVYDDNAPPPGYVSSRAARSVRRMKPQSKKLPSRTKTKLHRLKKALKRQGRWESSTWETANTLAPHERIALLQRTLNAPSIRP